MEKRKYKNTVSYMVISIIVFGAIIVILNYSMFTAKKYITQYNEFIFDNVKDTSNDLGKNLAYMNNTLMDIKMSDAVKNWRECKSWTQIHLKAINVQKELRKQTIYNNDLKYKVAITFLDNRELVVGSDITSQKKLFFNDLGFNDKQIDEIYGVMKDPNKKYLVKKSRNLESENYIHYFTKFGNDEDQLLYIISINEKNLIGLIKDDRGDYYLFNKEGILAKSENNIYDVQAIHHDLMEDDALAYFNLEPNMRKLWQHRGKSVIFEPIGELDWTLGYIYKPQIAGINGFIVGIIAVFIVAIILGGIIAKFATEKLYRPVKNILEEISGEKGIEEKGIINEFEYIALHNKKIEEANSQLEKIVEKNKQLIREKYYKELLNGIKAYKKEEYREYTLENESMRIVLIEFDNLDHRLEDEQTFTIKQAIKNKSSMIEGVQYINIDYKTCCLLFLADFEVGSVKKMVLGMIEAIEEQTSVNIKIFIGSVGNSLDELHSLFVRAKKCIEYKNAFPNQLIITEENIAQLQMDITTFPLKIENKLIANTIHGKAEALELLDELIKEHLLECTKASYQKKNFVLAIIVALNRIFDQMSVVPQEYLGEEYSGYLALYDDYNEQIPSRIKEVFEFIIKQVTKREVQNKDNMAEQMMEYIHKNYPDDIMLEDMAATLNISVKYCSVLFKRVTGENFKTVLNEYRIEKAKELLEQHEIKVSEVAEKVGFNSTNTFIRVFNKHVGVSPGIYQTQNIKRAL